MLFCIQIIVYAFAGQVQEKHVSYHKLQHAGRLGIRVQTYNHYHLDRLCPGIPSIIPSLLLLIQSSKGYRLKKCCKYFVNPPNASAISNISNLLLSRLPFPHEWSAERFVAGWLDHRPNCLLHRAF